MRQVCRGRAAAASWRCGPSARILEHVSTRLCVRSCATAAHTISVPRCPVAPVSRIPAVRISPSPGIVRVAWRARVARWSVARPGTVTPAVPVPSRSPSVSVPIPFSRPGSVAPSIVTVVVSVVVVPSAVTVLIAIVSVSSSAAGLMIPIPWGATAAASRGPICHESCEMWRKGRQDVALLYVGMWSSRNSVQASYARS